MFSDILYQNLHNTYTKRYRKIGMKVSHMHCLCYFQDHLYKSRVSSVKCINFSKWRMQLLIIYSHNHTQRAKRSTTVYCFENKQILFIVLLFGQQCDIPLSLVPQNRVGNSVFKVSIVNCQQDRVFQTRGFLFMADNCGPPPGLDIHFQ